MFRARAPLRVSLAGGGTDVPPFPAREGGLVLNATINRYAYGALVPRRDGTINVESVDFGLKANFGFTDDIIFDGELDLVKAAIRRFGRHPSSGYDLFLHSHAPPGSGLGSSSTVMVTLVGLLQSFHGSTLTEHQIADLAHRLEREDLGIAGGYQDHYAAAFGGFNVMEFSGEGVTVNPLRLPPEVVHELEHNMLLCYTGQTRQSDHIIEDQTTRFEQRDRTALEGLRMQKELAIRMKSALLDGRLAEFGRLLGEAWHYKKQMSPRVTTPFIDELYEEAIRCGAFGGKVTGAGGGGHILLFCPFQKQHIVAERLIEMGVKVTEIAFTHAGLTTWQFHD